MNNKTMTAGKTAMEQSVQVTETPRKSVFARIQHEKGTIGFKAEELAQKYFDMYVEFKNNKNKSLRAKAESLALHDLVCEKLVYEFALERARKMIDASKSMDANMKEARNKLRGVSQ